MPPGTNRRFLSLLLIAATFCALSFVLLFRNGNVGQGVVETFRDTPIHHVEVSTETLHGGAIMPKLGNETLKYVSAASRHLTHSCTDSF
jgi:hypothetical protein